MVWAYLSAIALCALCVANIKCYRKTGLNSFLLIGLGLACGIADALLGHWFLAGAGRAIPLAVFYLSYGIKVVQVLLMLVGGVGLVLASDFLAVVGLNVQS